MNENSLKIAVAFMLVSGVSLQASESSTVQKITTWLNTKAPSAGCALVGSLGFSLEGLPESTQRSVYKKCGWYLLGVTKDGKAVTPSERHPNAFDAINPMPHQAAHVARSTFIQSNTKWDGWADEILKKHSHKI